MQTRLQVVSRRSATQFGAVLLALAVAACGKPDAPKVEHSWIRLAAAPGRPSAAYFAIRGGPADWTLTGVATPAAKRAELHETMQMGRGMTMQPIGQVAVPAGVGVSFAPGGKHVMLFDVDPGVKPGDRVRLTLSFANGTSLTDSAGVVAAGDPPPTF